MLLENLRLLDNQEYGVAHGLLTGNRKNVWIQAQSLFDEVMMMDSSTASAFYNALTDMLWHFGQVSFSLANMPSSLLSVISVICVCTCLLRLILLVHVYSNVQCTKPSILTPSCSF